eukprot:298633-Chlamydomonas_euryale.AAC.6
MGCNVLVHQHRTLLASLPTMYQCDTMYSRCTNANDAILAAAHRMRRCSAQRQEWRVSAKRHWSRHRYWGHFLLF